MMGTYERTVYIYMLSPHATRATRMVVPRTRKWIRGKCYSAWGTNVMLKPNFERDLDVAAKGEERSHNESEAKSSLES